MPYVPLDDTLDSTNSLGSITLSGSMEDSSTGNQPNAQGGSEYSSGIDTASSGQLESASITSEILLANRGSNSAGSSDIGVVRLLNFDTLADAADALALVAARTTAQGTITTPQGSPAAGRFTITTTTDYTVNEEDVRRKRPRPPETTTTANPFLLAAPLPLAVPWPSGNQPQPPPPPPPVIIPRGVSTVPYSQLETVNNRLNKICGERDDLKEELRTQTVEIQKLRGNNRVLLGENLMLKQQQTQLLEIMDKKTVVIQVLKRHMELLEMINSSNKKNKSTKDAGTAVDVRDAIKLKTTDSQTKDETFDQMRQKRPDTVAETSVENDLSACDAVIDEVIQRCSSVSVDLMTDARTQSLTEVPDVPNSAELPEHVTQRVTNDVTQEYVQEMVNSIIAQVLQDLAGEDVEIRTSVQNGPGNKLDLTARTDREIINEKIDKKAQELVNNVIEKAVVYLNNEQLQSKIAEIDTDTEEIQNASRKDSLDILAKIPNEDKNNPHTCPACGYALSQDAIQNSVSDALLLSNVETTSEGSQSREIYPTASSNIDGDSVRRFHPTWSDKVFADFIGNAEDDLMMMMMTSTTPSMSEASLGKIDCQAEADEAAHSKPLVCDACIQTQEEEHEPRQSPGHPGRFRNFICCTRQ